MSSLKKPSCRESRERSPSPPTAQKLATSRRPLVQGAAKACPGPGAPGRRDGGATISRRRTGYLAASVARPVAGVPSTDSTTGASPADTPAGTRTLI